MPKIEVDEEFLFDLSTALQSMTNYADDGMLNRNDPEFKEFFDEVDRAREILTKLDTLLLAVEGDEEDVGQIPLF